MTVWRISRPISKERIFMFSTVSSSNLFSSYLARGICVEKNSNAMPFPDDLRDSSIGLAPVSSANPAAASSFSVRVALYGIPISDAITHVPITAISTAKNIRRILKRLEVKGCPIFCKALFPMRVAAPRTSSQSTGSRNNAFCWVIRSNPIFIRSLLFKYLHRLFSLKY